MSRNTSLFVKICEAKNLPIKDVSGSSDPYCVIKIDNQVIARTCTIWRSLNPFWGEEYLLHLPNGFHQMSLYVYDEDKLNRDDFIGKMILSREQLRSRKGISSWFELRESNKDEEIQGEVHLELYKVTCEDNVYIKVKVIEARELAPKDTRGTSDPFVRVSFMQITKQTQKIRASRFPKWHESIEFGVAAAKDKEEEICISVWDWDRIGGDNFMGQVVLRCCDITEGKCYNQWFRLLPSDDRCKLNTQKQRGSIRMQARLHEERILPSEYYAPLIQLLNDSTSPEKHDLSGPTPLKMLQDVTMLDLHEMSSTLVKLYLGQGNIVQYLDMICGEEILETGNANTLFRGNSLATKSVDQFMKIVGVPYLLETLGPIVTIIYEENKFVELDPFKVQMMRKHRRPSLKLTMSDEDLIDSSRDILLKYLNLIHENLLNTVFKIPPVMRLVFNNLQKHIVHRWPEEEYKDYKYHGVSGFLFLRFLVPAILAPKLFFLKDQHPSARISRTLTLIAKTLQCVGNLQVGVGKEQYLEPLHPFIKASGKVIRAYLDRLCDINPAKVNIDMTRRRSVFHPSVVVKQGFLCKKRWIENKPFKSLVFKKRYFWLKYDCISYAAKPTDQVRTTLTINQIIAVEFVDKSAFSKANVGQIILRNSKGIKEIVYFHAKDVNEVYSWVSSMRKMVLVNCDTLEYFHPGAFRNNKWTCCLQTSKQDAGCSKTHTHAVLGDWRDPLDPDVEAQTIYSQLHQGTEKLKQKYAKSNEEIKNSLLSLNNIQPPRRSSCSEVQKRHMSSHSLPNEATERRHSHTCGKEGGKHLLLQQLIGKSRMERRGSHSTPEVSLNSRMGSHKLLPQIPTCQKVNIEINVACVDDNCGTAYSYKNENDLVKQKQVETGENGAIRISAPSRRSHYENITNKSDKYLMKESKCNCNEDFTASRNYRDCEKQNNRTPKHQRQGTDSCSRISRKESQPQDESVKSYRSRTRSQEYMRLSCDRTNEVNFRRSSHNDLQANVRPEKQEAREMVTLFKAKSQNEAINFSGDQNLAVDENGALRRKSDGDCFKMAQLTIKTSRCIHQQRHSVGAINSRACCNNHRKASLLSVDSHEDTYYKAEAELSSLAQLLDVISDLDRVHEAFEKMELERKRDTLHNILDNSLTDLCQNVTATADAH